MNPLFSHMSVQFEGLSPGWAILLFLLFSAASAWLYLEAKPKVSPARWWLLTLLRVALLACFTFLLTRPVLFLTLQRNVRGELLVLLDLSQSMNLKDGRTLPEDQARAGMALGLLDPRGGTTQHSLDATKTTGISRLDLVRGIAGNEKIDLWAALARKADLAFYGFGSTLLDLGSPRQEAPEQPPSLKATSDFFSRLEAKEPVTALGDSLKLLLEEKTNDPIAAVLIITDGSNNMGASPEEAAHLAHDVRIPLYVYGVGITAPVDVSVADFQGPGVLQAKEKAVFTVQVRGQGVTGRHAVLVLKAKGQQVAQENISFTDDLPHQVTLNYVPPAVGEVTLEASIAPLTGESITANNTATLNTLVVDQKLRVLLVEQNPSWDFQYLLAMLQRDRRVAPKAVILGGDPGLSTGPGSPYLETMPVTKSELYPYQVVILGDADPSYLHENRMKMIAQWVENAEGGLIFRAGARHNPGGYHHTPLEPLFPVELRGEKSASLGLYQQPVHLTLTPDGEVSPLLRLSDDETTNLNLWREFPGVYWTAWVGRARPGAISLLSDPTSSRRAGGGPMPVIATQRYGNGKCLYVGLRETYRWRSEKGEKYFTRVWNQLLQSISSQTIGQSGRVRLRPSQPHYHVGDHVSISGLVFESSFDPDRDPSVTGSLQIKPAGEPGTAPPPVQISDLSLSSDADRPGQYSGEFVATIPGSYTFTVPRDPTSPIHFNVSPPSDLEDADASMNIKLLQQMADISQGRFLREEDLVNLPNWINSRGAHLSVDEKIDLIFSPWVFLLMLVLLSLEWLMRRLAKLK